MIRSIIYSVVIVFGCTSCRPSNNDSSSDDTLPASSLHPFGRALLNENHVELISSASHFGFTFSGTECNIYVALKNADAHNYIQYELDGVYQKRVRIRGRDTQPITVHAETTDTHTVWIYKATEAHTGPIFIEKITGQRVRAIARPDAPLIEFIGNSITCGAAADPSETACGSGAYHDQHNAFDSYGPRVARALHANFILSAVSGIGIYRNWNSDGPTMPQVYEKNDFQFNGNRLWDFTTYKPDVVSIALGTNDLSNGDGGRERLPFDSAAFVRNYIEFVKLIKSKYPAAQIALLNSPMTNGERWTKLQNCLNAIKTNIDKQYGGDQPVAVFFFRPMQPRGCTGHPNVDDHAILAAEVAPFFKAMLQE